MEKSPLVMSPAYLFLKNENNFIEQSPIYYSKFDLLEYVYEKVVNIFHLVLGAEIRESFPLYSDFNPTNSSGLLVSFNI